MRKTLVLTLLVGSAMIAVNAFGAMSPPTLVGTDGPGFTITLKENAKTVKTLRAGTYRFVIHDRSSIHGFSLDGPHGFAKDIASITGTGTTTITLKLKAGRYKFYCPNHESTMFGHFTVR
jgi:plastocyanin